MSAHNKLLFITINEYSLKRRKLLNTTHNKFHRCFHFTVFRGDFLELVKGFTENLTENEYTLNYCICY